MILFQEFLNVANEEKCTILGGKLFQTFTTRSLKVLLLTVMYPQRASNQGKLPKENYFGVSEEDEINKEILHISRLKLLKCQLFSRS